MASLVGLAGIYLQTQGVTAAIARGGASLAPSGSLPTTRSTCVLRAPTSGTPIPIAVWRPDEDAVGGSGGRSGAAPATDPAPGRPLILYAPGWGGRADTNEAILRNLASHGYLVVAFDDIMHDAPDASATPEDEAARLAGFDLSSASAYARFLELATRRQRLAARKVSRVIDALEAGEHPGRASPPPGWLDLNRIGMLGFSFGGSTAALAARQDPRLRAVVNMDGAMYGETATRGVEGPYLILNSEYPPRHPWLAALTTWLSFARANTERLMKSDYQTQLRQAARPMTLSLFIAGSSHGDFTDALSSRARWQTWRPWHGPMITPARQRAIIDAYLLGFFDTYLRDQPSPLIMSARSPFPEVRLLRPAAP